MRAAWYEKQGLARDVLHVGDLDPPTAGPGEVRVRISLSGVNPGDTKKRAGWLGSSMPFPLVVPHSDGTGLIESVGDGVHPGRVGRRVWVYGAQSYRQRGTAAEYTVVPDRQALDLPASVSDEIGACLGIPGITAHRAVFADGDVVGKTVLVHGLLGGVGSLAAQLAHRAGATVVGTVRRTTDLELLAASPIHRVIALDARDPARAIADVVPLGVDRIIEVAFSDNVDLDLAVSHNNTIIAAYATRLDRPSIPFWPMLFNNVTLRLLGSDDFPADAKERAAEDLTAAAAEGSLTITVAEPLPLARIAEAHERVDAGSRERILLSL
jgi:NADPH2:quinone reductase